MVSDSRTEDVPPRSAPGQETRGGRARLVIAGRVILAIFGGYAVAGLATALGAILLPLPRAEAVSAATLASFAVMAAAVIYVFAVPSLLRASAGLGGCAALLAAGLWLAGGFSPASPA